MTDQAPLPRVVPSTRGGDDKTSVETDLAALRSDGPRHERVLLVDLDPQPSAGGWVDADQPALTAVCTPNSHPHADGRVEHGYQLNVLDETLTIVATVDLPHWDRFNAEEAGQHLADAGFALKADAAGPGWRPSGLGHMTPVARTAIAAG
ncbi:hypothetical protein [Streptomyces sp. bgisy060]|uniref:hypothetical protein n=1 Tax=Streptomyces sp. bgisy060 TaxID=3413775 RepID=UPI003EBC60D5